VLRRPLAVLAAGLAVLLGPAPARADPPTVPAQLDALLGAGAIDQAHHDAWTKAYDDAKRTLRKLHGTRRAQLRAVISNTRALAAGGLLSPGRAPLVFLTLQRNRAWWASSPLLRYGQRVGFAGSSLVWQHYPGQGIQVQWLGTFGKANALFGLHRDDELRALLDEALGLAAPRAGGIAWEAPFRFDGGAPPWVSALTQGTAIQVLSRAAARLAEPRYFEAARAALGIFRTPPPEGVRVDTAVGADYLQYSFTPLARRGKPVYARTARFGYGRHAFAVRPRERGTLRASLRAVDAAGNAGAVEGVIQVRRAK
jgi:D-glucuronyl C5-epimerase C-terminus